MINHLDQHHLRTQKDTFFPEQVQHVHYRPPYYTRSWKLHFILHLLKIYNIYNKRWLHPLWTTTLNVVLLPCNMQTQTHQIHFFRQHQMNTLIFGMWRANLWWLRLQLLLGQWCYSNTGCWLLSFLCIGVPEWHSQDASSTFWSDGAQTLLLIHCCLCKYSRLGSLNQVLMPASPRSWWIVKSSSCGGESIWCSKDRNEIQESIDRKFASDGWQNVVSQCEHWLTRSRVLARRIQNEYPNALCYQRVTAGVFASSLVPSSKGITLILCWN